jgi:hypothetical protein
VTKTIKLSPAQARLVRLMHALIDPDKELWVGRKFEKAVPQNRRRRPTVAALTRHGLIEIGHRRTLVHGPSPMLEALRRGIRRNPQTCIL